MVYLSFTMIIVAFQGSGRYVEAAIITAVAVWVRVLVWVLPGSAGVRPFERWAAGHQIDPMTALIATFTYTRRLTRRAIATNVVWAGLLGVAVGAMAGATGWRLVQFGLVATEIYSLDPADTASDRRG